jgi:hypothetical protein
LNFFSFGQNWVSLLKHTLEWKNEFSLFYVYFFILSPLRLVLNFDVGSILGLLFNGYRHFSGQQIYFEKGSKDAESLSRLFPI